MSTTITNVTQLQAMEDDLTEDYILGNNINASATSGWNGGLGFDPIGSGERQLSHSRPTSDDFGYAGQGGSWTIYPADGVYYDKVDEETPDSDTTYIQATTNGDWCLLAHNAAALNLPSSATNITVVIRARVRNTGSGTSYIQGMMNINGTEYLIGPNSAVTSQSYQLKQWAMTNDPSMSSPWTIGGVFALAVAGVGVKVSDAAPDLRITQIWILVNYDLKFNGTFDGGGYTVSDLYIDRPSEDYVGLFGFTNGATIGDVELKDAVITGRDSVGALIGDARSTTISNIIITDADVTATDYASTCIGYSYDSTISECSVGGTVSGEDSIGSLVGWIYSSTISQCHGTGSVTGDDYVGGLIGTFQTCTMSNSYSRASATGDIYVGGLAAFCYSSETITNSYSTGAVTGNSDVGGLLGYSDGAITNCFWDTTTSGQASSDGGTGKTTAQMLALATFDDASWDIAPTTTNRNDGYPFLSWEIDESDTIWLIYGTGLRSFTIPDILDHKGRPVKNARVQAFRVDTHKFVEEELTDEYGSATFDELPNDVDVVFTPTWGGLRTPRL